jgi:uncharacterized protein (UPF0303 family)
MDYERDRARIAHLERELTLELMDADVAWSIGAWIRTAAAARGQSVAIDVTLAGAPLLYCATPGATPNNTDWIRRKKNVVNRFHQSSYAVALQHRRDGSTLVEQVGAPLCDFALAGGCFPIRIRGGAAVLGTITVSGLPDREDHELVVRALAVHLGRDPASVALDPT